MHKRETYLHSCIFIIYAILSAVFCSRIFSWKNLSSHAMTDGDPALMAWALQWVSHSLVTNPFNIFNGNTFYPNSNSIALSEHMFSLALMNLPFRAISKNPWVGYNLLIFISYFSSGLSGFFLIKYLTKSIEVGFWGGIFWGFIFFRIHHIGHLNIWSFQWIPFIILFLILFLRKPRKEYIASFVFFFLLQGLVSWYIAVITGFILIITFISFLRLSFFSVRTFKYIVVSAFICTAVFLLFAQPYFQIAKDSSLKERMINTLLAGDQVSLRDYLTPPDATLLGQLIKNNPYWIWGENTLFIGFIPIILAIIFILKLCKAPREHLGNKLRLGLMSLALIVIGFILSQGFYSNQLNTHLPLFYIAKIFSFFSALRATQRFSIMIYLGVLILSGLGMQSLLSNWRKPVSRYMVVIALSCLFLLEVFPYKLPLDANNPYRPSAIDQFIASNMGEKASRIRLLHYPIFYFIDNYPTREATYMVDSTLHWAKIVNGFSGEVPNQFREDMKILNSLPAPSAISWLQKYNIDLIGIHKETPDEQRNVILEYFRKNNRVKIFQVSSEAEYLIDLRNVFGLKQGDGKTQRKP